MFIKSEDKIYEIIKAGSWSGLAERNMEEIQNPVNLWSGPKRTLAQHQQVLAFFEWSYQTHKNEAQVNWFLNDTEGRWEPLVLPQQGRGLHVSLLQDHPNYIPTFQRLGTGWSPQGTDHHHCSAPAFQSGTDFGDEKTKEGLHITIGGIGSDKYSIHARSSFRHTIRPVRLSQWYELPEWAVSLPLNLQDTILEHLLTTPAKDAAFPEWWKENVIPFRQVAVTHTPLYRASYSLPTTTRYPAKEDRLAAALKEIAEERHWTLKEFREWVNAMLECKATCDLFRALDSTFCDLREAADVLEDMIAEGVGLEYNRDEGDLELAALEETWATGGELAQGLTQESR